MGAKPTTIVHVVAAASEPPHVPPVPGYAPPGNEKGREGAVAESAVAVAPPVLLSVNVWFALVPSTSVP